MITAFSGVLFGTSLIVLFAAGTTWQKRNVPGGLTLTLALLGVAIWCFFSAMETTSLDAAHRYLWRAVSFFGLCNVAPLFLVFALQYSDSGWPLNGWTLLGFWAIPATTIVLAFTNSLHHLIWTGFTPGPIQGTNTVIYKQGPWYYIALIWFLAQCLIASYHLLRVVMRTARLYLVQAGILLVSVLMPWVGVVLYLLPHGPFPGLDTASPGFAVSAVLIVTAFNRLHFLDLVPNARATLLEHIQESFLVLDSLGRITDFNRNALRALRVDSLAIGAKLAEVFPALAKVVGGDDDSSGPPTLALPGSPPVTLEVSVAKMSSRSGNTTGTILLLRNITERRHSEEERERLISELRDALAKVKKLSGLLPICASCKRIRDDNGYWQQVESYMKDHAEVEFSHGMCPECAAKMYDELNRHA